MAEMDRNPDDELISDPPEEREKGIGDDGLDADADVESDEDVDDLDLDEDDE